MAKVIRVAPPGNFYNSQLGLAAGFGLFHGHRLRKITGGQLPIVSFHLSFVLLIYIICSYVLNH